ncbi:hypothetical protein [Bacillus cereus]|uniref:hypothetical protein n=1 Tax=Bacillus cereus TaxID=1396 RepID=UPI00234C143D|nr:hypothetical protein [Bacillus cereus]MDC7726398.1 hypothetical protein [Bacillus cereus]
MLCVVYKKIKNVNRDIIKSFLEEQHALDSHNEGVFNLEFDSKYISFSYYKILQSLECVYDKNSETVISETANKTFRCDVIIFIQNGYLVLYGDKTACTSLDEFLYTRSPFSPYTYVVRLDDLFSKLGGIIYFIKEIKYKNVKFLGTSLPSLSLEFNNNTDAFNTLKKISSPPSNITLIVDFQGEDCSLDVNLNLGNIFLSYNKIQKVHIENIKETLLFLFEEA